MSESNCVIGSKPHEAVHGYLCGHHFERLADMLREIEDQAALLDAVPSMEQRQGSGASLASERSPAILDAIVARDPRRGLMRWSAADDDDFKTFDPWGLDDTRSVLETLHNIARQIREDCQLTPPENVTIASERNTITRQLDWLARQSFVDETYGEVGDLLGQLKGTNKTKDDPPAGTCYLMPDGAVCGGRIWRRSGKRAVWSPTVVGGDRCERIHVEVADGPAYCERCRTEWDGAELDRLNIILEQQRHEAARPRTDDGRPMLTAQELVEQGHVSSLVNVRVKAHRLGLVSVDGHYDPEAFGEAMSA